MKKALISNLLLTVLLLFLTFLISSVSKNIFSQPYYVTIVFFGVLYSLQSLLLFKFKNTTSTFIITYNITTMLKMLISLIYLILYFLFFLENTTEKNKILFVVFFITIYFVYLIFNTKSFFRNKDEK